MLTLLIPLTILLSGYGLGNIIRKIIGLKDDFSLENIIIETSLGFASLSMILFLIGFIGWLKLQFVWGLLFLFSIIGIFYSLHGLRNRLYKFKSHPKIGTINGLILVSTILFAGFLLLVNFAPPIGNDMSWDGLGYHLPVIKTYVQEGKIIPIQDLIFSNYTMGMDILFAPGIMLNQHTSAQIIHYIMGIMLAMIMAILGRQLIAAKSSFLISGLILSIPLIQDEMTWPLIDLGVTLYSCLALITLMKWQTSRSSTWLVISGIFIGFACSIKTTAFISLLALSIVFLLNISKMGAHKLSTWIRISLLFGLPLIVFMLPWYLKNYLMTGNPFLPYLYTLFGGKYWSITANVRYFSLLRSLGVELPFIFKAGFSAILIILALYLLNRKKLPPQISSLISYTLIWISVFLNNSSLQKRFLLPLYPLIVFLIIWTFYSLTERKQILQQVGYGAFFVVILTSNFRAVMTKHDALSVVFGIENEQEYLKKNLYIYDAQHFFNEKISEEAKIFVFPDTRTYYLDKAYFRGDPLGQVIIDYTQLSSPVDLLEEFRDQEITHVMIQKPTYDYYLQYVSPVSELVANYKQAMNLITDTVNMDAELIYEANGVSIFKLSSQIEY